MTTSRKWTAHKLTEAMLKRLACLAANIDHHHGTSMAALKSRGLAEDGDEHTETIGYGYARTICLPCCRITEAGREALAKARAEGW